MIRRGLLCTLVSALFAALLGVIAFGGVGTRGPRASVPLGADFVAFWSAATLLHEGRPEAVYGDHGLRDVERRVTGARWAYRGLYPPPLYQAAEVLLPLGYRRAAQVHLVLGATLLALAGLGLAAALGVPRGSWWGVALATVAGPMGALNLLTGQNAGLWLGLVAGGWLLLRRGRPLLAGLVLGLLCAKPQYGGVAALWLLLVGERRALVGFVLGGAGLVSTSLMVGGLAPWHAWLELLSGDTLRGFAPLPQRGLSLPALARLTLGRGPAAELWGQGLSLLALVAAIALGARPPLRSGRSADASTPPSAPADPCACPMRGGSPVRPRRGSASRSTPSATVARLLARRRPRPPRDDPAWPRFAAAPLSALLLALPHMMDYDGVLHGPLLLAAWPGAGRRGRWLLAAAWVAPALGEAGRWTHLALSPLLLAAVVVMVASRSPDDAGPDAEAPGPTMGSGAGGYSSSSSS